ncbi:hypothetical protein D041_4152A, partial [Vibrio parahaemolyticus EKP-008]
MVVAL